MAITDTQKVDYLWKKVGYGKAKTSQNTGGTGHKNATQESIPSPLFTRGENVWSQADLIPGVIPATSGGVVTVYPTSAPIECVADTTSPSKRTWKTQSIDWIPPEVGSTYLIKVYIHTSGQAGSAASSGDELSAAESNEEWFFDYASGTLNFIGTNLPQASNPLDPYWTGKSVYISGAVYTGIKGVAVPGAGATFTTLGISSLATFTDTTDNVLGDSNTGAVQIDGGLGVDLNVTVGAGLSVIGDATFDSNISLGQTETVTISGPENIIIDPHPVGVGTTSGNVYIQGDLYVQGRNFQVDSTTVNIADKVIGIATTCTDDILLDGAGLGIGTDGNRKTLLYHNASTSLKSSENFNIASGKVYQIDQTERLSADTLSLGTGTTIHSPASNTLILGTNGEERARIISDGKIGIATTTPESLLDINGTLRVAGISTFNALVDINDGGQANTFKVEDLTNDRVVIAGTGGELEDDGNFTFTGTELTVGSATTGTVIRTDGTLNVSGISTFRNRVGIGTTAPQASIHIYRQDTVQGQETHADFILENPGKGNARIFLKTRDNNRDWEFFADDNDGAFGIHDGEANRRVFTISTSSYIGIGTLFNQNNQPRQQLDVAGGVYISGDVGIGSTQPTAKLDVDGTVNVTGISTFDSHVDINNTLDVLGISTFQDRVIFDSTNSIQIPVGTEAEKDAVGVAVTGQIRYNTTNDTFEGYGPGGHWGSLGGVKDVDGDTFILAEDFPNNDDDRLVFYTSGSSRVAIDSTGRVGIGTTTDIDEESILDVYGKTELDDLRVTGITTFKNSTNNVLGDSFTGAVLVNGGLGVAQNVTVGGGLSVTGDSFFVGMVTFASGADGNITIGNSAGDNLVINADIDSHIIPDDDDTYDLGSSTQEWRDLYIDGTGNIDSLVADTAAIGDLTEDRVVIVGPSGELEDSANLTFDGTKLTITDDVDVTESLTAKQVTADYFGEQNREQVIIDVTSAASKSTDHRYFGLGSARSFLFDGDEAPYIQFIPGKTYRFKQSDSSNTGHKLKLYLDPLKTTEYTDGVSFSGTPGTDGYTEILVTKQTPSVLYYQSESHDRIGNEIIVVNSFSLLEHNVGIGTTVPLQALQVGTSSNPFVVTSVGNVGIATTNPTADLDVVGLTELDNLNVSGISTLDVLGVTGFTTTQDFEVVGLSTFNDDIRVSFGDTTSAIGIGTTVFTPLEGYIVDIRGQVNIVGGLIVGGTDVGTEITSDTGSFTSVGSTNLNVTGIATFGPISTVDVKNGIGITGGDVSIGTAGTGFYYDDSAAKVGIGITTPQYKLDVDGDIHVTGFTTTARLTVGTGTSEYTFPDYDGLEGSFLRTDGDGNIDWFTNTTIRTTFNATAGAGQTVFNTNYTPGLIDVFLNGVKLSSSDYVATNGTSVVLNAAAYVNDNIEIIKFNNDNVSSRPILDYWRGSELNNEIFNITDNVGIGTSVPTQLLDVDGNVRIRGGLYDVGNASGSTQQVPVADGLGGWVWSEPPVIGVSTAGGSLTNVQYHNAAGLIDGSNEFVFDYSSNEVGIGTANPETKLDVRGGTRLGNLSITSAGIVTAISGAAVTFYGDGKGLTNLNGSNIASGTISSERLAGTYNISITGSISGTNVDTTDLTVSNSAQFGPTGSGTTFVKIDNAGNLDVSGIGTISTLQLGVSTVGVSSILDEDTLVSNSDTALATQQSIKTYVDTEIDALALNVKDSQGNSALTVDLSSENLIIDGTANEIETSLAELGGGSTDKKLQIGLPNDVTVSNIVTANVGFANTMSYSNTLLRGGTGTNSIILHSDLDQLVYRSIEYSIQISQGSDFQFTKILAVHDGTNVYSTEYGTVFNNGILASFDVDLGGGLIRLLATANSAASANYVVNFTANKV